jgi:hypothetical protein
VSPIVGRAWAVVRALLITLAIALGLIAGWPMPDAAAIARLPPALRGVATTMPKVQAALLAPFRCFSDPCQLAQRWTLFSTTGGVRYRLWVEARSNRKQRFRLLYRAQDPEHAFMRGVLEYRRVRNAWNPSRRGIKQSYAPFTVWLSRAIFLQEPELNETRIRLERVQILEHGEGIASLGDFSDEIVHTRAEIVP